MLGLPAPFWYDLSERAYLVCGCRRRCRTGSARALFLGELAVNGPSSNCIQEASAFSAWKVPTYEILDYNAQHHSSPGKSLWCAAAFRRIAANLCFSILSVFQVNTAVLQHCCWDSPADWKYVVKSTRKKKIACLSVFTENSYVCVVITYCLLPSHWAALWKTW